MAPARSASTSQERNSKSSKDLSSRGQNPAASVQLSGRGSSNWSKRAKLIVSLLVVFQLLAVIAEPLHFFSHSPARGPSHAVRPLRAVLAPYVEFSYLNHGYFFFAPEPGPSHLMQCSMVMPDGTTATLRYPDKQAQWPRLLYHRHFMLSEFLNQLHVPPVDPVAVKEMPEFEAANWQKSRKRFEDVRSSMQSHLAWRYGANAVTIERLRHILPGADEVLSKELPLNDPKFYIVLPDSLAGEPEAQPLMPLSPLARPSKSGGEKVEVTP